MKQTVDTTGDTVGHWTFNPCSYIHPFTMWLSSSKSLGYL